MGEIKIDGEKCKGCMLCINVCPKGLIIAGDKLNQKGSRPAKFTHSAGCSGCSMCAVVCPECCIEVYK